MKNVNTNGSNNQTITPVKGGEEATAEGARSATVTVTGLTNQITQFFVKGANTCAKVTSFSITYTTSNVRHIWRGYAAWQNTNTNGNFSSARFAYTTPTNSSHIRLGLDCFTLQLGTASGGGMSRVDGYMAFSEKALTNGTNNVDASEFAAISTNTCGLTSIITTMKFENAYLKGKTKYYVYFVTKNDNGTYNIPAGQRYYVEEANYGMELTGSGKNYTIPFVVTFLGDNYKCVNKAGYELMTSNFLGDDLPTVDNYSFADESTDLNPVVLTYALTTNPITASTFGGTPVYHRIIMDRANSSDNMPYYAEEGGAVKIDNVSKSTEQTKWFFVGNETDGYKLYNKLFGEKRVAQVASAGNDAAITMVDASSNDGTLFDIRYVSNAYRLYLKGTAYCTNRLSSTTLVAGIHENVNAGSQTTFVLDDVITAYTDIKTDKVYTIKSSVRGYLFGSAKSGAIQNNSFEGTMPANSDKWAFVQSNNGKYYLYNVGFGQFFNNASLANGATEYVDFVEVSNALWQESAPVQINLTGFNASYDNTTAKYINMQGKGSGYGNQNIVFNTFSTVDEGNLLEIKEAGNFNSDDKAAAELQLREAQGGFVVEDATSLSAALAGAPSKIFRIKGPLGYLIANSEGTYMTNTAKADIAPDEEDLKQQWVLLQNGGNTYLYNVYAKKFVGNDAENANQYTLTNVNDKQALVFGSSNGNSSNFAQALTFPVTIQIGTSTLNLNNNESFTYGTTNYNHPEDKNNMFRFEELDATLTDAQVKAIVVPFNYYSVYESAIKPFVDNVSNEYFHLVSEGAKKGVLNASQYSDGAEHSYYTQDDITNMWSTLHTRVKMPLNTVYYRIKNNNTDNYINYGDPSTWGKNLGLIAKTADSSYDLTNAFRFDPVKFGQTYKLYLPSQDKYVGKQRTANQPFPLVESSKDATVFSLILEAPGVVYIVSTESSEDAGGVNEGVLHEAAEEWTVHGVVNWKTGTANSQWTIEEAPDNITMISPAAVSDGEDVFMTFGNNTGVALCPTGTVKVYQAYAAGESTVRLSEVESKEIPAGAGVVLCAKKGTKQFFTILSSTSETLDRNELVKGDGSTNVTSAYMLAYSNTDTDAKFYKLSDSGYVVPANKAYLPNTSGVRMLSLSFDETTGLENVEVVDTLEGTAYDLQGRRVQKVQKGLYIVNGKKIFVK